ncbi:MAG: hypothetical protein JWO63_2475 [Frankiales bacterium]|nr:hypothetical protein [Frankiales bacterium]
MSFLSTNRAARIDEEWVVSVTDSEVDVVGAFALYRLSLIRLAVMLVDDPATAGSERYR